MNKSIQPFQKLFKKQLLTSTVMATEITWRIGGPAGSGLVSSGDMLSKACSRAGYHIYTNRELHSNIKGMHTWASVRISAEEIYSHVKSADILVALDQETADKHIEHLSKGSAVIYDPEHVKIDDSLKEKGIILCGTPLVKIALEDEGKKIMQNTVALGVTFNLLGFDFKEFEKVIKAEFSGKKESIIKANIISGKKGYDFAEEKFNKFEKKLDEPSDKKERIFLNGNQALAFGAVQAGCKFMSAYPMTPATGIMMALSKHEREADLIVKQTEDELAAILTAAGAAHSGVRAMTATSGGGFALMNEGLGMVGSAETPLVVTVAQRPGPSSGLPTRTAQCDLKYVVNAAPGEVPRIVIAPGDEKDCFYKAAEAFNLAEKYQIPVIIISDKYLGMNYRNTEMFDTSKIKIERGKLVSEEEADKLKDYKRYSLTEDGVSPRVIPGKGPVHITSSYVVDEAGNVDETPENAEKMLDKLYKKIPFILKDFEKPKLIGPEDADVTLIFWGSTKGPVREALKLLEKDGIKANYLQIIYIEPFQTEEIKEILEKSKKTVCIEGNKEGQLADIIKAKTGIDVNYRINDYTGRPFYPEDIYKEVKKISND